MIYDTLNVTFSIRYAYFIDFSDYEIIRKHLFQMKVNQSSHPIIYFNISE